MALHSPVPTPVHPTSWSRPAGNLDYQETRDLATHKRLTPGGLGCDFSNGREGAPCYAMEAGKVYQRDIQNTPGMLGHGSLILRIRHPDGASSGYAHLKSFSVALGAVVAKGQQIGIVGATGQGITGPHLHCDYQKPDGTHHEVFTLIDQGDDMTTTIDRVKFLGADGKPADRSVSLAAGPHTGYKPDGTKKAYTLASASSAPARSEATITQVPDKDPHGPGWLEIVGGVWNGYYLRKGVGVTPAPDPSFDTAKAKKEGAAGAAKAAADYTASLP